MYKTQKVSVKRNETSSIVDTFPLWEIPILQAVHNEVELLEMGVSSRVAPAAEEEYVRLENRYKYTTDDNGARGISFMGAVYGQHGVGLERLQAAIDKATVSEEAEAADLLGEVA